MKHIFDWVLISLFIVGLILMIVGILSFTYRLNLYLGMTVSGIFIIFFTSKLLNKSKV